MTRLGLVLLAGMALVPAARAQSGADLAGLLGAMDGAYERLDYATAEQRAREALAAYALLSADQLVRVHTTLGLILHARNEPLEAREQFVAALSLNPALELDPVMVSPKTLAFFDGLRAEGGDTTRFEREAAIRYVQVRDPRPAATLRSLAVPGWGQLYKGERTKGWVLVGAWGLLAGGTVAAHLLRAQARQNYLDATDPAEIAGRYDTYNTWSKARGGLGLGTVAVWAYATIDALVFGGPGAGRGLAFAPMVSERDVGLRMQVQLGR